MHHKDDWEALNVVIVEAAVNLERAHADLLILCTHTMHLCCNAIQQSVSIPFLHIAAAPGEKIREAGLNKVLLLGTRFTMEKGFFEVQ